jgi:hypothetical protein
LNLIGILVHRWLAFNGEFVRAGSTKRERTNTIIPIAAAIQHIRENDIARSTTRAIKVGFYHQQAMLWG